MYDTSKLSQPTQTFKPGKFKKVDWTNVLLVVVCLFAFAILGCGTLTDHVMPCAIDARVTDYVDVNVPTVWGFTSLYHAKDVAMRIEVQHRTQQLVHYRALQDDDLLHSDAAQSARVAIAEGKVFKDIVVGSEDSPVSLMGMLAGGAPALLLGRAMKRKQDFSTEDVKKFAKKVEARTREKVAAETQVVNVVNTLKKGRHPQSCQG